MTPILIVVIVIESLIILFTLSRALRTKPVKMDGNLVVTDTADRTIFTLELDTSPEAMAQQKQVHLLVKKYSEDGTRT